MSSKELDLIKGILENPAQASEQQLYSALLWAIELAASQSRGIVDLSQVLGGDVSNYSKIPEVLTGLYKQANMVLGINEISCRTLLKETIH